MSEHPVYLTEEGYKQLQEELHFLKTVRRQQVAEVSITHSQKEN